MDKRWAFFAAWSVFFVVMAALTRNVPALLAVIAICGAPLSFVLPQYYELRDDSLFIRKGWGRFMVPYRSIVQVQRTENNSRANVLSTSRRLISTSTGKVRVIAVAEELAFLTELRRRCPQLERKPFGLGFPISLPLAT